MSPEPYLHEHPEFAELISIVASENHLQPSLVEKDYWIMHCLHGLATQGFTFELKGGTSLSKGYGIIHRFSEDIDIRIDPVCAPFAVYCKANQTKKSDHIASRKKFYDWLARSIKINGIDGVKRDAVFDDSKYRSGGIRLHYNSKFDFTPPGIKEGILLEAGFDDTKPNFNQSISSWLYEKTTELDIRFRDNRAIGVPCYHPGYTFVEKLQTISTKFRQQQKSQSMPHNFIRHYYDICMLLDHPLVTEFIGTPEYQAHKEQRFRSEDNLNIEENEAFLLSDESTRSQYKAVYHDTAALYMGNQVPFENLLERIHSSISIL